LLRELGFGMAFAMLLDAMVVRTHLVPAMMPCSMSRTGALRAGSSVCAGAITTLESINTCLDK